MQTHDFLRILQQFPVLSVKDAEAVLTLKENYPFSQVLHTLSARVSKDHGFQLYQPTLQLAAVYAADRAVLKEVIEGPGTSRLKEAMAQEPATSPASAGDLATQVMNDLQKLHKLRENFELLFVDPNTVSIQTSEPVTIPVTVTETSEPAREDEPAVEIAPAIADVEKESEKDLKSRKERIVELARSRNTIPDGVEFETVLKSRRRKKEALDSFIDQIAITKEELTPESEKHKEQIEIIDHFIRIQPSITGSKEKQDQVNDLSTIKTGDFTENIISETLVEILLKQGKKEKAMEVLKKLIWKFPQKKAYFASQIEELKK